MGSKLFDLTGRIALVTGSSRGIGKELAKALADAGATLVLHGRNSETLALTTAEFQKATAPNGSSPTPLTSPTRQPWQQILPPLKPRWVRYGSW